MKLQIAVAAVNLEKTTTRIDAIAPTLYRDPNGLCVTQRDGYNTYGIASEKNPDVLNIILPFQNGVVTDGVPNGITNETLIAALIHRLTCLNAKFPCPENLDAINGLNYSLGRLEARTANRVERGVEGKEVL